MWNQCRPGGQRPLRCSVTLWITSCPWPVVWMDPVGYHCSVCTPSAGNRNVYCRLWYDRGDEFFEFLLPSPLSVLRWSLSPTTSLFSVNLQQVRGNLARLRSCVEELRSIPNEGCVRGAARGSELLRQAVLDSLQQFKQYIRHTNITSQASSNISLEVMP